MKNKKLIIWINIALTIAVIIGDIIYMNYGKLWLKGTTSFGFVLLGAINLLFVTVEREINLKYRIMLVIGLFFSMLGDIVLNIHFISGALLFAVGHVFYFIAHSCLIKLKTADLIPSGLIFVVSALIIILVPIFDFGSVLMEGVCVFYAFVISLMVGKAAANFLRNKGTLTLALMVGCILFYFSDLMLLFNTFSDVSPVFGRLCLSTYYPAQCILAVCVGLQSFLPENRNEWKNSRCN